MGNVAEVKNKVSTQKITTVEDFLTQKKDLIAQALPATITPDRLIGVFTMVLKSSPQLAECSQSSLIAAVIQTVQLGLTPGNIGHCHYVPFNSKKGKEVQFIIGYKGIVELVNRCGKATLLSTEIVYENDKFNYSLGLNPVLEHVPTAGERGQVVGVYCVAKNLVANEKVFVYMPRTDIDKVMNSSKAAHSDYSPWKTWFEEMCKKTVIKRICKLLPLSVEDQKRIATDETIKNEIAPDMTSVKDDTDWQGDTIETKPATNSETEKPQPEPAQPDTVDNSEDRSKFISEPQRKRLMAIAKKANWSKDKIDVYILETFNIKSTKDIKWGIEYDSICDHIEKHPEAEWEE